jgi:hypothetical protein
VLRFLQIHPSLSYAFAGECVSSASQGPRPDEGVRERFEELEVSLDRLESRGKAVTPEELWGSLAPLLVDASGNTHRAEVNVEKLWNSGLGPRGLAGLVELSLRMPRSPRHLVAIAALFRSICARLVTSPAVGPLREWGLALHERWALPFFLEQDLRAVLEDLSACAAGRCRWSWRDRTSTARCWWGPSVTAPTCRRRGSTSGWLRTIRWSWSGSSAGRAPRSGCTPGSPVAVRIRACRAMRRRPVSAVRNAWCPSTTQRDR